MSKILSDWIGEMEVGFEKQKLSLVNATGAAIKTLNDAQVITIPTLMQAQQFAPVACIFFADGFVSSNGDVHVDVGLVGGTGAEIMSDVTLTGLDTSNERYIYPIPAGVIASLTAANLQLKIHTADTTATAGDLYCYVAGWFI